MKIHTTSRVVAASLGAFVLTGVTSLAFAETEREAEDVTVTVDVADLGPTGVLAMSVASNATALTENGSDVTSRVFTGTLPTVTVTDTRAAADIPGDAFWYVLGTASDFTSVTSGTDTIGAENLGWSPHLIDGGESGFVAEGDVVDVGLDGGPGLVDRELLAMAESSVGVSTEGRWTATADLVLKTVPTVTPGSYASTITLSLFE